MILIASCTTPTTAFNDDACLALGQQLSFASAPGTPETAANTQDTDETVKGIRHDNARKAAYCPARKKQKLRGKR